MELTVFQELYRSVKFILWDYIRFATMAFVLFYFILKRPLWFRKIQKKMPKLTDYSRDVFYSIVSVGIFAIINTITFYYFIDYTNLYYEISDYGIAYYAFTWVWMFFLHDTCFYWTHRAMHHPTLFKHVHLVHHKSHNPSPWTAYAFHPFEAVMEASILPIIAFTLPVHNSAISLYFILSIVFNVYAHLGFELFPKGFHKTWIGRFFNTSVAHNLHHDKFHGNYGLYFLIWDRWMGTVREDYDTTYEVTTEGQMDLNLIPVKQEA